MKERSSSFFFWLCSKAVGDARFLGIVLCFFAARLHGGGAGCMEVLGFQLWLLPKVPFALFKSSIGAACLLQIIAYRCLPFAL